ncbi:MAG: hypothetical protein LUE99_03765 [Bacteroides sp.]|nr:hypothetical protein [Bacteroides sp.]
MEKNLIHSNELHFIDKKRIHQAVEKMVESLDLAAGSTTGFNLYAVVESYFTDLEKRREINRLLKLEQNTCEEIEEELGVYEY